MPVHVELVGRRIHLTGWIGPRTPDMCKSVTGATAKFDKKVHPAKFLCWTYGLDYTTCLQLRKVFGKDLTIGPELTAWAREEKKSREGLNRILGSTSISLPAVREVSAILADAMQARPYQQVGSAFLASTRRGLIADEPGLGKTLQIMGAIVEAGVTGPILVTAPSAAIQITWPQELSHWLPEDKVFTAIGDRKKRMRVLEAFQASLKAYPASRHWLLSNFEMARSTQDFTKICQEEGPFSWEHTDKRSGRKMTGLWKHAYSMYFRIEWSAIVADESQRALITKTSMKHDQSQQRAGMGMLRIREGGLRIAASGTPFRGKRENLWGTLNWLRPDVYTSYWNWAKKYFIIYDDGMHMTVGDLNPAMEKEFYAELDAVMIRRKKLEVVPDLPPKQYPGAPLDPKRPGSLHGIWLPLEPKQAKAYKQMVEHAAAQLESGTLLATGALAELTRLKQFASCHGDLEKTGKISKGYDSFTEKDEFNFEPDPVTFVPTLPSNKFNWLLNWLIEQGIAPDEGGDYFGDNKVIIASQFTKMINLFREELEFLGVKSHAITGQIKSAERKDAKDAFQAKGGPRVFFLNTDAGGVSLTLDAADDLIFLDEKWIPDDQEQVEDRAHRVSRMHQVRIWYLRSLGTIEEQIGQTNENRDSLQKMILDGRRGVDFARKLIGV